MATLTVDAVASMDAARAEVSSMGDAVRGLGTDANTAGDQARNASVNFEGIADSSDNVASKSSQAAGAMGDLAGGLEAVGLSGAATALEGVALGSQVAAGAGDALNLVSETAAGRFIAQTAATVAHRTATIAGSVATGAMTVAQGALNVVLAANPVLLIVIALAALAAGLVLAYKHSETFRNIVDGAFSKAREVVTAAAGAVEDIIGWFKDLPGEAREAWEAVSKAVQDKIDLAIGVVQDLVDLVTTGPANAVSAVTGAFSSMFAPIETALGWVEDLLSKLSSAGGLLDAVIPGRNARVETGTKPTAGGDIGGGPSSDVVSINLTVARQDQDQAMADLVDALRDFLARRGQRLSITEQTP